MNIPQVINRFNLYKGGNKLIGISGEVELPGVTLLTDTLEGAGVGGNLDTPVIGLTDQLDMTVPFQSINSHMFQIMDPTESVDLTLNGAIQGQEASTGKIGYTELSIAVRGMVKEFTPGTVKAGAKMESSIVLSLTYYKIVLGGKTVLEIDKLNDVFVINGKDILQEVRSMC